MKTYISNLFFFLCFLYIPHELLAQFEHKELVGIPNMGKPFNKNSSEMEYYEVNFSENSKSPNSEERKRVINIKDIIGKEMVLHFENLSVDITINSDSTLYWKDKNNSRHYYSKIKAMQIDANKIIVSCLEANKTFVALYSDFGSGKISALLYGKDGILESVKGSIALK